MLINGDLEILGSGILVAEEGIVLQTASGVASIKSGNAEIFYNPGDDKWYVVTEGKPADEIARKSDIPAAVPAPTTSGYTATMTSKTQSFVHGMGTRNVTVSLVDTVRDEVTFPKSIKIDSTNQVTIKVNKPRSYEVTIIGVI